MYGRDGIGIHYRRFVPGSFDVTGADQSTVSAITTFYVDAVNLVSYTPGARRMPRVSSQGLEEEK